MLEVGDGITDGFEAAMAMAITIRSRQLASGYHDHYRRVLPSVTTLFWQRLWSIVMAVITIS